MVHREPTRAECTAPLLLVKKSPPANPFLSRTSISEQDVTFSQSWFAASFAVVDDGLAQARWLQLLLQSGTFLYFALLTDGWFGVERDHYILETLKAFPVVPYEQLTDRQRKTALKLSEALWTKGWSKKLQRQIDALVLDLYEFDDVERDSIGDTLATALPYAEQRRNAVLPPQYVPTTRTSNCFIRGTTVASLSRPVSLSSSRTSGSMRGRHALHEISISKES